MPEQWEMFDLAKDWAKAPIFIAFYPLAKANGNE
jgi:hypothetical protein